METSGIYSDGKFNPNFLNLLAGIGARIDPYGVGGNIGIPAIEYIKAQAASERADKVAATNDAQAEQHRKLIEALQVDDGALTLPDQPGITNKKLNPDGSYTITVMPKAGGSREKTLGVVGPQGAATPAAPIGQGPIAESAQTGSAVTPPTQTIIPSQAVPGNAQTEYARRSQSLIDRTLPFIFAPRRPR